MREVEEPVVVKPVRRPPPPRRRAATEQAATATVSDPAPPPAFEREEEEDDDDSDDESPISEPSVSVQSDEEWLDEHTKKTVEALRSCSLRSRLLDARLTPNSALLKFAGSPTFTVEAILRRKSELLTTHGIAIISVRPEPSAIRIAVARPERNIVQLDDVWERWSPEMTEFGNTDLVIGVQESNGELLMLSPASRHAPHTLIAGSTGSGKSVLMQNLLLGIGATNTPEQATIDIIDPKLGVDYFAFERMPHLNSIGIITEQEAAIERLREIVGEMDRRYREHLRPMKAMKVTDYNRKVKESDRLPIMWVIHDEFAEWMMTETYKNEVTNLVGRLGVKARAAGIHLLFAAQRPDKDVMPMQLRANLGNRLILRVDSEGTSQLALGEHGAEQLLGRGHMIAKLDGEHQSIYAQVPFVDTSAMERIVDDMKTDA